VLVLVELRELGKISNYFMYFSSSRLKLMRYGIKLVGRRNYLLSVGSKKETLTD